MSLYAQYLMERENKRIVETELGFATFYFLPEKDACYIEDIYVRPEYRKNGEAAKMADEIAAIARDKGCKYLLGSVSPSATNSTASLQVLIAYGFRLDVASPNFIVMKKDL
jgi:ribosomal protein S18 acetylase RimI-like enzyme